MCRWRSARVRSAQGYGRRHVSLGFRRRVPARLLGRPGLPGFCACSRAGRRRSAISRSSSSAGIQPRAPRHLDRLDQRQHPPVERRPAHAERLSGLGARIDEPFDTSRLSQDRTLLGASLSKTRRLRLSSSSPRTPAGHPESIQKPWTDLAFECICVSLAIGVGSACTRGLTRGRFNARCCGRAGSRSSFVRRRRRSRRGRSSFAVEGSEHAGEIVGRGDLGTQAAAERFPPGAAAEVVVAARPGRFGDELELAGSGSRAPPLDPAACRDQASCRRRAGRRRDRRVPASTGRGSRRGSRA